MIDLLENLIKNGVTQEELNMTKGYLHGSFNMALANNDRIVTHNGTRFLLHPNKKIVPFIDLYDIYYKNISKEQLDNVIKKYFVPNGMFICMVGDNLPSEKMLYKICNKLEKK